jgi:hypothetical protein
VIVKELEQQLLALRPSEKVQVIQLFAQSLGSYWQGIEKLNYFLLKPPPTPI